MSMKKTALAFSAAASILYSDGIPGMVEDMNTQGIAIAEQVSADKRSYFIVNGMIVESNASMLMAVSPTNDDGEIVGGEFVLDENGSVGDVEGLVYAFNNGADVQYVGSVPTNAIHGISSIYPDNTNPEEVVSGIIERGEAEYRGKIFTVINGVIQGDDNTFARVNLSDRISTPLKALQDAPECDPGERRPQGSLSIESCSSAEQKTFEAWPDDSCQYSTRR